MKSGSKKGVEKKRQIVMEVSEQTNEILCIIVTPYVFQEREQAWYIPPSKGIPVYKADNDPNCPAARVRKFNEEQKQKIKQEVRSSAKTEQWVKTALDRQYSNAPLRNIHDFRAKAAEYTKSVPIIHTQGQVSEISILQQIIVRENLLNDLFKICRSNNDLYPIISEITELIKAIRYETLDVIENIADWQAHQPVPRPFIFKGVNYLIKMRTDMDFLDQYDEIVEKFCFEFRSNPLAYRGGGTVITGFDYALSSSQASMNTGAKQHFNNLVQAYQTSLNEGKNGENMMVDGISLIRLHNAEKVRILKRNFNSLHLSARYNYLL